MRDVLLKRDFFLLWMAGLVSISGDRMLSVALPLFIYAETGSVFATSTMVICMHLPVALLGSAAGVYVDRWNLQRVLVITNALRATLLITLLVAEIQQALWILYAVGALEAAIGTFFGLGENALLPRLVSRAEFAQANVLNSLNNNLALLIGPILGALVLTTFGLFAVVLADVVTYLVGAALIALIRNPQGDDTIRPQPSPSTFSGDMAAGLRHLTGSKILVTLLLLRATSSIGEGLLVPQWIPFLKEVLQGSDEFVGLFISIQGIGGLIGGVLFGALGARWRPLYVLCILSFAQAFIDFAQFNLPSVSPAGFPVEAVALGLVVVFGLTVIPRYSSNMTLLQLGTAESFRGRAFGVMDAIASSLFLVGLLSSAPLSQAIGIVPVMNAAGLLFLLGAFVVLYALRRSVDSDLGQQ